MRRSVKKKSLQGWIEKQKNMKRRYACKGKKKKETNKKPQPNPSLALFVFKIVDKKNCKSKL